MDIHYNTGASWQGEFVQAAFNITEFDKRADLNASLSAIMTPNSKFVISPAYHFNAWLDEYDTGSSHSLFLESSWTHEKWEFHPAAGFSWENMDEFTDNAEFRLDIVRNF